MMLRVNFSSANILASNVRNLVKDLNSLKFNRILSLGVTTKSKTQAVGDEASAPLLTKTLVSTISENHKLSKAEARRIIDTVVGTITESLADKTNVKITGLGTFKVVEFKARTGRNPRTGESISIPAKQRIRFTPISYVKNRVAGEEITEKDK